MFIDEVEVEVHGGRGGDGCISFHHEKFKPRGGPDGGDGGEGGKVVVKATSSINTLTSLKGKGILRAGNGEKGGKNLCHGKKGDDLLIELPIGTEIIDIDKGLKVFDLIKDGEIHILAHGGKGGRGNAQFASPRNRTPVRYEKGEEGERRRFLLILKLVSDLGIIGNPNSGKSTLLSRLSSARPKIAPYPFTTIYPNLGVLWIDEFTPITIIDTPPIVKGAKNGEGLGNRFLRHILRTRLLIHVLDVSDEAPIDRFKEINEELRAYEENLLRVPQIVVLNKCDLVEEEKILKIEASLVDCGHEVISISALKGDGISLLKERIRSRIGGVCGG